MSLNKKRVKLILLNKDWNDNKTQAGLQLIALVYRKYLFWLTRQLYNRLHNLQANQSLNTFIAQNIVYNQCSALISLA